MKKLIFTAIIILLVIILPIILIPGVIRISQQVTILAPSKALVRNEVNQTLWHRWWPGKQLSPGKAGGIGAVYSYDDNTCTIRDKQISSFIVDTKTGDVITAGAVNFIAVNAMRSEVIWEMEIRSSFNPFARIAAWMRARELRACQQQALASLKKFYSNDENIYELAIRQDALKDTLLVSTFAESKTYPGTELISSLIAGLHRYAELHNANETGKPMLNISIPELANGYQVRVAIPVDKRVPALGNTGYKLMPPMVRILTADVTGGQFTADRAMERMHDFATDHSYNLPAIPFFSLVTDRDAQPDTSKWVTRIYYPIM